MLAPALQLQLLPRNSELTGGVDCPQKCGVFVPVRLGADDLGEIHPRKYLLASEQAIR
ncbi:hypothetical protein [Nocardia sp. NPDC005366]|uniref:hypothetical protein n=1 Tax=Nocardia sp. NPDC005366 TaxID=3156878 RepID=UPI0033A25327